MLQLLARQAIGWHNDAGRADVFGAQWCKLMAADAQTITRVLEAIDRGDPQAPGDLLPLVYEELRRLASARMAREGPGLTLQPTALVHEAYVRLVDQTGVVFKGRAHFFGAAALAMRRILVERARRRDAARHGGGLGREERADFASDAPPDAVDMLALDEALEELARVDARLAEIVHLRYFAGQETARVAELLGVSERTVERDWVFAKAWLRQRVGGGADTGA